MSDTEKRDFVSLVSQGCSFGASCWNVGVSFTKFHGEYYDPDDDTFRERLREAKMTSMGKTGHE